MSGKASCESGTQRMTLPALRPQMWEGDLANHRSYMPLREVEWASGTPSILGSRSISNHSARMRKLFNSYCFCSKTQETQTAWVQVPFQPHLPIDPLILAEASDGRASAHSHSESEQTRALLRLVYQDHGDHTLWGLRTPWTSDPTRLLICKDFDDHGQWIPIETGFIGELKKEYCITNKTADFSIQDLARSIAVTAMATNQAYTSLIETWYRQSGQTEGEYFADTMQRLFFGGEETVKSHIAQPFCYSNVVESLRFGRNTIEQGVRDVFTAAADSQHCTWLGRRQVCAVSASTKDEPTLASAASAEAVKVAVAL